MMPWSSRARRLVRTSDLCSSAGRQQAAQHGPFAGLQGRVYVRGGRKLLHRLPHGCCVCMCNSALQRSARHGVSICGVACSLLRRICNSQATAMRLRYSSSPSSAQQNTERGCRTLRQLRPRQQLGFELEEIVHLPLHLPQVVQIGLHDVCVKLREGPDS